MCGMEPNGFDKLNLEEPVGQQSKYNEMYYKHSQY
jgi:hypothetical protein